MEVHWFVPVGQRETYVYLRAYEVRLLIAFRFPSGLGQECPLVSYF